MASPVKVRGAGFGLDAELAAKASAKYDVTMEREASVWISAVTGTSLGDDFGEALRDGVALCRVINVIEPNSIRKIETSNMPFKQRENISHFLQACRRMGVKEYECFETVDLFDLKDLGAVVRCLHALGRNVQRTQPTFRPTLGVKEGCKTKLANTKKALTNARDGNINAPPTLFATAAPAESPAPINVERTVIAPRRTSPGERNGRAASPVPTRGAGFGLDAELAAKAADKYDYGAEAEAQEWMEKIVGRSFPTNFADSLHDGVFLCHLINKIAPGTIKRVNENTKMPFKQMENISYFLKSCRVLGVAEYNVFETVDLFDQKDLGVVVTCIHALGRSVQKTCPSFHGPVLGRKESSKNLRTFSQKQLNEASSAVSLLSLGSSQTMERGAFTDTTSVTFGHDASK